MNVTAFVVLRWIKRSLILLVAAPLLCWAYLQLDGQTLSGLQVRGQRMPRTKAPEAFLERVAQDWAAEQLQIVTGQHLTRAMRSELGAQLNVVAIAPVVRRLGHTGNPFLDLWVAADAIRGRRDVPWSPTIDRIRLGRYVRAVRNLVERPPVAGARDNAGWSMAGVAGITFDTVDAVSSIERLLHTNGLSLEIPMRQVLPPQSVAIGSPDAVIYEEGAEHDPGAGDSDAGLPLDMAALRAAQPRAWMPDAGCEPMDPPYQSFCQGPRRVAMPYGEEAELADRLELGTVQTVGHLLSYGPRSEWVAAANGPRVHHADMLWPTPNGTLWRRFGFVRKPPFESLLHRGIDIGAQRGAPLMAVNDGIIAYSDNRVRGYGNLIVVIHDDATVTFSAHCKAIYVFAGQRVRRGQIIGEVGDTGLARGVHIHWEYHVDGKAADPDGLLNKL